ncbi:hypothetical protein VTL71DRAFT_6507 [Oculimacula yallundae]|uniref:Uncharacterized protein n=1 Tax=Oculimacula yallundae TaxID=86028 RepID=A0ABR4BYB1_9HELO
MLHEDDGLPAYHITNSQPRRENCRRDAGSQMWNLCWQWSRSLGHSWKGLPRLWFSLLESQYLCMTTLMVEL